MVDVLSPLSARPPTPPRTASRTLSEKDRTEQSPVIVQTPIESPFPPNGSTGAPSSRQSKRVNFSPWPKYIKPPTFTNAKSKVLLPSNECKPARSILKATNSPGPLSLSEVTSYTPETFAMLLESVTQQLAGDKISSRSDAYMQFFNALRAYEKVPTEEEIVRKLGLITQFIQRDISRDLSKGGPLETNVVIQALKLSVVFVWHPQISPHLPEDFKLFLVDHAVSCLENGRLPKSVLIHYLSVLSQQKYQPRIMTNARISRILAMLNSLTDKVKGNGIVSQRLLIYERIFELNKSAFVSQPALWMNHILSGLLHHVKDVRLKALDVGFNAYMSAGATSTLSKTLRDIFDQPLDQNKRKLASEICERMTRMMASPETGEHVPQIWGVLTLLLRNKRFNIDQWPHFKEWVLVLQKCFNCSDPEIKSRAITNWNRFVLVVNISETTSRSLLRMLSKPILSQFERKKIDKQNTQPSGLVVSSYHNLLYYAFRPDASFHQLDIVWEEYIALPSEKTFSVVSSLSDRAAHAISNMLWSSQPLKAWSENRVNELKKIVAEELPPLDCKWVRSRIAIVLKVFESLLKSSVWETELRTSHIAVAWTNLIQALAFAASKEITPSPESMQAVAHVLAFLQRIWKAMPLSLNAFEMESDDKYFDRFAFLSTTMVNALGNIPVTEKLLLKTAESAYPNVSTSTNRHSTASNHPDSPILHLLRLISDVPGLPTPTIAYSRLIDEVVGAACHGKVSRGPQLDILRQCVEMVETGHGFDSSVAGFAETVWKSTANLCADCLSSFPTESARERDGLLFRDYDNVIKILTAGLSFADGSSFWDRLLGTFLSVLRTEKGEPAVSAIALAPLAAATNLLKVHETYSPTSSIIKHCLTVPFHYWDRNMMNQQKGEFSEPPFPTEIVGLVHWILKESYDNFTNSRGTGLAEFTESVVSFLASGSIIFRCMLLEKLQEPLGYYLRDVAGHFKVEGGCERRMLIACQELSAAILNILGALPRNDATLQRFERTFCSGLRASEYTRAEQFLAFWDSAFECQLNPGCPIHLHIAVQDVKTRVSYVRRGGLPVGNLNGIPRIFPNQSTAIASKDVPAKSRIAFILDAPPGNPVSALTDPFTATKVAVPQETRPTEQTLPGVAPASNTTNNESPALPVSDTERAAQHSQVFSMIDNLRSSSPIGNTPRALGFMTPPHLRNLRNEEPGTETPKTPTIPAVSADNEDTFLGSSPTPAIRGRTSSVASAVPPSFSAVNNDAMEVDPPSSPPELDRQTPDSHQPSPVKISVVKASGGKGKKRNRARRSRRSQLSQVSNKENADTSASQNEQSEQSEVNTETMPERGLRTRLRSSTDKNFTRVEDTAPQDAEEPPKTLSLGSNHEPADQAVSAPEIKVTDERDEHTEKQQSEQPDAAADSSDDTDTQATSQLEYDLVSAVDLSSDAPHSEVPDSVDPAPVTRKRKRDEEAETSTQSSKERRRSSRLSSSAAPTVEIEDSQPARSKKQKVVTVTQEAQSSPAVTAAETHEDESAGRGGKSPKPENKAKKEKGNGKVSETQESSQKRRSGRISGVPAPDIPEESPVSKKSPLPKKSPRPSSARKSRKQRERERRAERRKSQLSKAASEKEEDTAREIPDGEPEESLEPSATDNSPEGLPETQSSQPGLHSIKEPGVPEEPEDVHMAEAHGPKPTTTPAEPETTNSAEKAQPSSAEQPSALPEPEHEPVPEPEQEEPTPQPAHGIPITTSLRTLLDQVKLASLDRDTIREMDNLLFDLRVEMHEAMRRHGETTASQE
ncbi:Rap1-interacting factor 1 N terminal-domain-containing protein [Aspergillus keveii]|uniref:Rap1-interacting factor 1 N terminal-domain-containing protein n=1 Tax=Aspergillus keveii TaxID=714993 RepID=A0ABR4FRP7_9EURO